MPEDGCCGRPVLCLQRCDDGLRNAHLTGPWGAQAIEQLAVALGGPEREFLDEANI